MESVAREATPVTSVHNVPEDKMLSQADYDRITKSLIPEVEAFIKNLSSHSQYSSKRAQARTYQTAQ